MTDQMRFEPALVTARAGETVRFVLSNSGALVHEFYIGDEAAQDAHEDEMRQGAMVHDDPAGISVEPGETGELDFTFDDAGELLFGCHEEGHYAAGMVGTITVEL
jgi:uncharacterized cupredoxin-like copper-binding protein